MIGGTKLASINAKPLSSNSSPDPNTGVSIPADQGDNFEIRVRGQLSDVWADWFEGLTIERLDDGEMLLSGTIVDQSALLGVLNKLGRLNLALISLNEKNRNQKENE
jgi:hypothetical protein